MSESSRPPSPTTSTWVCCSSSSSWACCLWSTPSWPCHLRLTADLSGNPASDYKRVFRSDFVPNVHVCVTEQRETQDVWCGHGYHQQGPAGLHGDAFQLCGQPRPHHASGAAHGVSVEPLKTPTFLRLDDERSSNTIGSKALKSWGNPGDRLIPSCLTGWPSITWTLCPKLTKTPTWSWRRRCRW